MKRYFMKPGLVPISNYVHHVEFVFDDEEHVIKRAAIDHKGKARPNCPWNFRDAMSLATTGHWAEVVQDQETGEWIAPSASELKLLAQQRLADPDVPVTMTEMVW